jgi:hypothetical protein
MLQATVISFDSSSCCYPTLTALLYTPQCVLCCHGWPGSGVVVLLLVLLL